MDALEERVRQVEVRMALVEQRMDSVGNDVKDIKNTLTFIEWQKFTRMDDREGLN